MKNRQSGDYKGDIRVYGAARCHKTQYYLNFLKERNLAFTFLDVEKNEAFSNELRSLYQTGRLSKSKFINQTIAIKYQPQI